MQRAPDKKIENLELVEWLTVDEWRSLDRMPVRRDYSSFHELALAIDELGPLMIENDRVNVTMLRTSGRFAEGILAVRQSGFNVRRIFISPGNFETVYGDVPSCVSRIMSNNAIGPEIELTHLQTFCQSENLDPNCVDMERVYTRDEIDAVAAAQMVQILEECIQHDPEGEETLRFLFAIGFTAGRAFSSLQASVTLEPYANAAMDAKARNQEKGRKSGSADRRLKRLDAFTAEVEKLHRDNPAFRSHEDVVLKVAFENVVPKGSYGHGQFESYCVAIKSEEPFKSRFDALFRNSVK